MTLVVPQDHASVIHSLKMVGDPENMAVTYGVLIDTAAPPASAGALAATLATAFKTHVMPVMSTDLTLVNTEVSWQDTALPAPPVIGSSGITQAGSDGDPLLPQNSAYLVHKRTSYGGRGGRGRMFLPGVRENEVDSIGAVTAGTVTTFNTALSNWLTAIFAAAGTDGMVLLHDSVGAFAAVAPYIVTGLNLDPVIATQRRRLRR
jgi:hypothetical protein